MSPNPSQAVPLNESDVDFLLNADFKLEAICDVCDRQGRRSPGMGTIYVNSEDVTEWMWEPTYRYGTDTSKSQASAVNRHPSFGQKGGNLTQLPRTQKLTPFRPGDVPLHPRCSEGSTPRGHKLTVTPKRMVEWIQAAADRGQERIRIRE